MRKLLTIFFLFILVVSPSAANWHIHELFDKLFLSSKDERIVKKSTPVQELKEVCDEKQLILQLSRLYVTSPERIVLLLSTNSLKQTCAEIAIVLEQINNTISECLPLPDNNLYKKLYNGLDYFNDQICLNNVRSEKKNQLIPYLLVLDLRDYHECVADLRDDLLDCEGPPDWFEKSNKAVVCEYFNDIINCNYIKAAMLCGLKPAVMLRAFSAEIMKRTLKFKCKISRSLPQVDDPMPARSGHLKFINMFIMYNIGLSILHFIFL